MLILHGGLIDGQFVLWGETSEAAVAGIKRGRGRPRQTVAPPHPWGASEEALRRALSESVPGGMTGSKPEAVQPRTVVSWLPSEGGEPLASSPILRAMPDRPAPCALAPWAVTGLALSWDETVTLLCACIGRDMLGPGVLIGPTLLAWATALRWTGALVARQQFLPAVEETADGFRACWKPVFAGADAEMPAKLARALPGACRALSSSAEAPPDLPAVSLLTNFVSQVCDTLARHAAESASSFDSSVYPVRRARKPKSTAFDSLHDQWLYALRAPDGRMQGEARELAAFARQVREWWRPLTLSIAAPFRLCFRLEEPVLQGEEGDDGDVEGDWFVRLLLQSVEDPSLLVAAEQAWNAKGRSAALLRRDGFVAREFLLAALGQAAKICPQIEATLKSTTPDGYELDTIGAQEFLLEKAWLLEQAGFVVQLPAWWTRKGTKQRLTARASGKAPKMQAKAGLSLATIAEFDWEVALGGETLTRSELEMLAQQKTSLVRLRGQGAIGCERDRGRPDVLETQPGPAGDGPRCDPDDPGSRARTGRAAHRGGESRRLDRGPAGADAGRVGL
ncbi:MAG TPA: SNF2 helicase-associated domain-containing protein [Chthonomonadaceae bacterium]|nr:SNF2 helicase-associated domain-containing protein [Chthonomonadaceae bacterium]